jgi:hypothetical protein
MAHTENWSTAYEQEPADSDSPSGGDDEFRDLKRNVRERMELEHYWKDSTTDDGKHLMGSGKGWVTNTEPTNAPSGEALDATDTGQFWFNDTDGELFIYTGANFVPITKFDTNVNITGTTTVAGALTVTSNIDVTGTLTVAGAVDFDSNLNVAGTLTVAGTTDITSALNVTGSGTFDGGIDAGSSGTALKCKVLEIGDWDIDSDYYTNVAHGLGTDWKNVRSIDATIRNDDDNRYYKFLDTQWEDSPSFYHDIYIDSTNVRLEVNVHNALFRTTDFDSTSYNRGWITIWYEA